MISIEKMGLRKIKNGFSCFFNYLKFKYRGFTIGSHFRGLGHIVLKIDRGQSTLQIGRNFILVSGGFRNAISRNTMSCIQVDQDASLIIGNDVRMSDVVIWARKNIIIGNFVTIGADSVVFDSNAHPLDWEVRRRECTEYQKTKKEIIHSPVIIEDDVFIGTRCIICKGVTIGARSIIAAGSVVVTNIPSDVIAGGNPCKVIKRIN